MKPLIVLLSTFVIAVLLLRLVKKKIDLQSAGRIAMAVMLAFTALGHFLFADGMAGMLPEWVPFRVEMVLATGVLEVMLGIGLLVPRIQKGVGWGLIVFFALVLPANIHAAIEGLNYQTGELDGPGLAYLWFRVPLQVLFVAWVWGATHWKMGTKAMRP